MSNKQSVKALVMSVVACDNHIQNNIALLVRRYRYYSTLLCEVIRECTGVQCRDEQRHRGSERNQMEDAVG